MEFSRILISFFLVFAFAHAAQADFSIGPIAGISVGNITTDSNGISIGSSSKTNFSGGVSAEIGLSDVFSFQPELVYISKGGSFNSLAGSTTTFNLNYLEVPLLIKPKFALGDGATSLYGLFGPSIGFKVSSSASINNGVTTSSSNDGINSVDFSLHFGVGVETKLADNFRGFFDVRYLYGLTNVATDTPSDTSIKNRTWLFLVGGRFIL